LAAALSSCTNIEQIAPTITSAPGASSATLAEGRAIYTRQCTSCHAAERVKRYTRAEWSTILPDMAHRSKLSDAQAKAVRAYVMAVLDAPPAAGVAAR
jgi:mono/diheme cytochrome c family protein